MKNNDLKRNPENRPHKYASLAVLTIFLWLIPTFTLIPQGVSQKTASIVVFSKSSTTHLVRALSIDKDAMIISYLYNSTSTLPPLAEFEAILKTTDTIFVDRYLPQEIAYLEVLISYVNGSKASKGLVVFGFMTSNANSLDADINPAQVQLLNTILPVNLPFEYKISTNDSTSADYKIQTKLNESLSHETHFLIRDIPFESMPAISYRTIVTAKPESESILLSIDDTEPLIIESKRATGGSVIFSSIIIQDANLPFTLWPYFNYMIYCCALHTAPNFGDSVIDHYYEWSHAPVPHLPQIIGWFTMVACLWVISFAIYFKMKKVTAKDPHYQAKSNQTNSTTTSEDIHHE